MSLKRTDITVLGGGVIGLSIALRLLNAGREVVLIDPEEPGTGTSFGNAGTIAEYAVLPVGSPDIIRQLPSLLFNKNSPIAIKRSAILSLCPWLLRFLYQSMPKNAARNAQAITSLLQGSRIRWEELSSQIGGESLLKTDGNIYLYPNEGLLGHGIRDIDKRKELDLITQRGGIGHRGIPGQGAALEYGDLALALIAHAVESGVELILEGINGSLGHGTDIGSHLVVSLHGDYPLIEKQREALRQKFGPNHSLALDRLLDAQRVTVEADVLRTEGLRVGDQARLNQWPGPCDEVLSVEVEAGADKAVRVLRGDGDLYDLFNGISSLHGQEGTVVVQFLDGY